jgi:ribosomal protein S18 acetylase RimI-like enzyme
VISVRTALSPDVPGVYRVCLLTGDAGADATGRYRDPDLLGHVFAGPYLRAEPDLALVVVDEEGVAGYCLATPDTRAFEAWCEREWWPSLRARYPLPDDGTPDGRLVRWIHAPWSPPDAVVAGHPAHLHVNLLARARGTGLGRDLMERTMSALATRGAPALHVAVSARNEHALGFYRHLGFRELPYDGGAVFLGIDLR